MRHWVVTVPEERYAIERLYHNERLDLPNPGDLIVGDRVVLLAPGRPPVVFGLGRVAAAQPGRVSVEYERRLFDTPLPADDVVVGPVAADTYHSIEAAARRAAVVPDRTWLVSVDLPIEAPSPAEAVRRFWSYVRQLGPRELPAFVSPADDELAMQAYVLGEQANLDPEEDE
ncbi:MAG TPA: hypothetical protein VF054_14750 [Micromonosporaceae bacterium]